MMASLEESNHPDAGCSSNVGGLYPVMVDLRGLCFSQCFEARDSCQRTYHFEGKKGAHGVNNLDREAGRQSRISTRTEHNDTNSHCPQFSS